MKREFYINEVSLSTGLDSLTGSGNVEVTVRIAGDFPETFPEETGCFLSAWITGKDQSEKDRIFPLPIEREMSFCMCVEKPELWNAEQAYVYDLNLEIVDQEETVLDAGIRKLAFWKWEILDGKTCLNKREVEFRTEMLPKGLTDEDRLKKYLEGMKKNNKNTLLVQKDEQTENLIRYCILYGIYLVAEGEHVEAGRLLARQNLEENRKTEDPDFLLQVVGNGVLIENHCVFANASEYDLYYMVSDGNDYRKEGKMTADVPAKTSRFVEVPFEPPAAPGEYSCYVSLQLREDASWAEKGYSIAEAETRLANLFQR